jgi:hypothetical protein
VTHPRAGHCTTGVLQTGLVRSGDVRHGLVIGSTGMIVSNRWCSASRNKNGPCHGEVDSGGTITRGGSGCVGSVTTGGLDAVGCERARNL